jgi:hypothetical protein
MIWVFYSLHQHNQINTSLGYDFVGNETIGSVSGIDMTLVIFNHNLIPKRTHSFNNMLVTTIMFQKPVLDLRSGMALLWYLCKSLKDIHWFTCFWHSSNALAEEKSRTCFKLCDGQFLCQISELQYSTEQKFTVSSCSSFLVVKYFLMSLIACKAELALLTAFDTCSIHCNFESNVTPSTLVEGFDLINTLERITFKDWISFLWNKHSSVFDSFTFSPESLSHLVIVIRVTVRLSFTSFLFFDHLSAKLLSAKLVI